MSAARDTRLRRRARETIRYELEGAAKDGVKPNNDWTELVHGRDVLSLLRERDALRAALELIKAMPTSERNPDGDEQAAHSMRVVAEDALASTPGQAEA